MAMKQFLKINGWKARNGDQRISCQDYRFEKKKDGGKSFSFSIDMNNNFMPYFWKALYNGQFFLTMMLMEVPEGLYADTRSYDLGNDSYIEQMDEATRLIHTLFICKVGIVSEPMNEKAFAPVYISIDYAYEI